MLGAVMDVFRLKQMFGGAARIRELGIDLAGDLEFLDVTRRAVVRVPYVDRARPGPVRPFTRRSHAELAGLRGRRVALMATGGSGALASVVGMARAFEDADIRPALMTVCSGSALFGYPIATGRSADDVADFLLSLDPRQYLDVDWQGLSRLATRGGRGFVGIVKGDALEREVARFLGDVRLGDLAIPTYAPVWSYDRNLVEYIGPRTHPRMTVARAVRMAVSLPLFFAPVEMDDELWGDGGVVDIFPVRPVLDIEEPPDAAVAVNGFYPPEFAGEDATGWEDRRWSILLAASQIRTSQQIQLARDNLRRLRERVAVEMISPVAYEEVRGLGFYRQFIDQSDWSRFMHDGRIACNLALRRLDRRLTRGGDRALAAATR